jgi:ABC-type nitrate/sulfonate/bicarbonate transport system permease component
MRGRLLPPAALIALWLACAWSGWPSPRAFPTPGALVAAARADVAGPALWLDLGATLARLAAGLAITVAIGVPLGIVLGSARPRWRAAEPTVDFLRAVPPILTFPLFLLALGYGEAARVAAVAFGTVGILLLQVAEGLARAPRDRADAVRLAGLRGVRAHAHLHLWEALPSIVVGLRLALAAGLIIVVVTEMLIGAPHGLGVRALGALLAYRADELWVVILVAGAVGQGLSLLVTRAGRRLVHWEG